MRFILLFIMGITSIVIVMSIVMIPILFVINAGQFIVYIFFLLIGSIIINISTTLYFKKRNPKIYYNALNSKKV